MSKRPRRRRSRTRFARLGAGARNAMDVLRLGRLGERSGAPFDVMHEERAYRLRRYPPPAGARAELGAAILLVPPLMLTAEIYDVAEEVSTVRMLGVHGLDAWVVDFGAPERQEGGLERTVDDHVRAVSDAVKRVVAECGRKVHIAGYSQGGMFAYQAAALRRCDGVASVITFGSPVDIHRAIPALDDGLAARLIGGARRMLSVPIGRAKALPGTFSSVGFKLTSPRKEAEQIFDFIGKLHDRKALQKREDRRRFLGGEGFVAWPGPALRQFIDDFIVHNRMMSGGFVIDGQTLTLADITCPILALMGTRDDIARPPTVRAITRAAPNADVHLGNVPAGHFGLVVGSAATTHTWPTVVEWVRWVEGRGPLPPALDREVDEHDGDDIDNREVEDAAFDEPLDIDLVSDAAATAAATAWRRMGEWATGLGDTLDSLRWQVPRVARLARLRPDDKVSFARSLAEQSRRNPNQTFFLWRDRAFTYEDADRRVTNVVKGLVQCGVQRWQRVGILMDGRPSFLSAVTAVNRLGAVAVLMHPTASEAALEAMVEEGKIDYLICDPNYGSLARGVFGGKVLVLGGGGASRRLPSGLIDMEAIDPDTVELPKGFEVNPARASDVSLVMFRTGRDGRLHAAEITNRRWAFSAHGAAAGCTLSARDTVYAAMPLHHPTGYMVSAGSAIVSGARLALASELTAERFWKEVRRYGATVVFYAGDMCRLLVNAPSTPAERDSSLRLFAGSGMRADVWRRVLDRFTPAGVLEFYASTEGAAILVNASGAKIGALGRALPGSADLAAAQWDFDANEIVRREGRFVPCDPMAPGMLVTRLDSTHPRYAMSASADNPRILRDAREDGDVWFVTHDIVWRDDDGDYWFFGRLGSVIRTSDGPVSSMAIEDALYRAPEIALAAAYGVTDGRAVVPVASVTLRPGDEIAPPSLAKAVADLAENARPRVVIVVERIPMTDGFRAEKEPLAALGLAGPPGSRTFRYDSARRAYQPGRASGAPMEDVS